MTDWGQLHAYVDGQLSAEERGQVEAWIESDPRAQEELEAIQSLKSALQAHCQPADCEEVWAKCRDRLQELDRRRGVEKFVGKWAWGLCSIFIVAILSAAFMNRSGHGPLKSTDLMSASLAPISSPQSNTADAQRRWLRDLELPVKPEAIAVDTVLQGVMNGQRVVRVDLHDADGPMSLFVATQCKEFADKDETGTFGSLKVSNANGVTWSQQGMSFLLVGSRSADALQAVAEGFRR